MPTSYKRKRNFFEDEKKPVFWLEKLYFSFCFHRSVHKVILEKKGILRHFAQNHKYLQLEKSTKYCKKGTIGIYLEHGYMARPTGLWNGLIKTKQ